MSQEKRDILNTLAEVISIFGGEAFVCNDRFKMLPVLRDISLTVIIIPNRNYCHPREPTESLLCGMFSTVVLLQGQPMTHNHPVE